MKAVRFTVEQRKPYSLKKLFIHTNFATKKFGEMWSEWWGSEIPPKLEVDMIHIFEDVEDHVLIVGVEVEFYRDTTDGKQNH